MDIPLNFLQVKQLRDPPWSNVDLLSDGRSVIFHDGRNNAAIHDLGKNRGRRQIPALKQIFQDIVFMSCSAEVNSLVGLLSTGDAFICSGIDGTGGGALTLVRGKVDFREEVTSESDLTAGRPSGQGTLRTLFFGPKVLHDYSKNSNNVLMCFNGQDSVALVKSEAVIHFWQADTPVTAESSVVNGIWSDFDLSNGQEVLGLDVVHVDRRWHTTAALLDPNSGALLTCTTFARGVPVDKSTTIGLPYAKGEVSNIVLKQSASNDAATMAVAVNFANVSKGVAVLIAIRRNKSVLTANLGNHGNGEQVAAMAFTFQGNVIVCLTKNEKLFLLSHTGMLLRTFSSDPKDCDRLCPPASKINLKLMYDVTDVRVPVGHLFLSVATGKTANELVCSNGVVLFHLHLGSGLERPMDFAELLFGKAEVTFAAYKERKLRIRKGSMPADDEDNAVVSRPKAKLDRRRSSLLDTLVANVRTKFNGTSAISLDDGSMDRNWREKALQTPLFSATLDLVLYYLKHPFLHSLLLARQRFSGQMRARREWRRMNSRAIDILLACLVFELRSGVEVCQSRSAIQILQMLESASSDSGYSHFRMLTGLVIRCVKTICEPSVKVTSVAAYQITDQMVSLLGASYPKTSSSALRRFFLGECYRLIHDKAGAEGERGVLSKLQLLFQTHGSNLALYQEEMAQRRSDAAGTVAYYKGQYAKAIFLWTKQILDPKVEAGVKERRLLSILYTLIEAESYSEVLVFLNWAYAKALNGFTSLITHFLMAVGEGVRSFLPPESVSFSGVPNLRLNAGRIIVKKQWLPQPRTLIMLSLANANYEVAMNLCRTHGRWQDLFVTRCLANILHLSTGEACVKLALQKLLQDDIDFGKSPPHPGMRRDLTSLSDRLSPGDRVEVAEHCASAINSLLDACESRLLKLPVIMATGEHCLDSDSESAILVSISWLKVLFSSGLCAAFSRHCPPAVTSRADELYLRFTRLNFCLRLRRQFKSILDRVTTDGVLGGLADEDNSRRVLQLLETGRKIHVAFPGFSSDPDRRRELDETMVWACMELPDAIANLDLTQFFPNSAKFASAKVLERLGALGLTPDKANVGSTSKQILLLSDFDFRAEWKSCVGNNEPLNGPSARKNDAVIDGDCISESQPPSPPRLRWATTQRESEMLSVDRKKGLLRSQHLRPPPAARRNESNAGAARPANTSRERRKSSGARDEEGGGGDAGEIYSLPLWSKFCPDGEKADSRRDGRIEEPVPPALSWIVSLCAWSRECVSTGLYDEKHSDSNDRESIFRLEDALRVWAVHKEWAARRRCSDSPPITSPESNTECVTTTRAHNAEVSESRQLPAVESTSSSPSPPCAIPATTTAQFLRSPRGLSRRHEAEIGPGIGVRRGSGAECDENSKRCRGDEDGQVAEADAPTVLRDEEEWEIKEEKQAINSVMTPPSGQLVAEWAVSRCPASPDTHPGDKEFETAGKNGEIEEAHLSGTNGKTASDNGGGGSSCDNTLADVASKNLANELSDCQSGDISLSKSDERQEVEKEAADKRSSSGSQISQPSTSSSRQDSPISESENGGGPPAAAVAPPALINSSVRNGDYPASPPILRIHPEVLTMLNSSPKRQKTKPARNVSFESVDEPPNDRDVRLLTADELETLAPTSSSLPAISRKKQKNGLGTRIRREKAQTFVALPPLLRLSSEDRGVPDMPVGYSEAVRYFMKEEPGEATKLQYKSGQYYHLLQSNGQSTSSAFANIQFAIRKALDGDAVSASREKTPNDDQKVDDRDRKVLVDTEAQTIPECQDDKDNDNVEAVTEHQIMQNFAAHPLPITADKEGQAGVSLAEEAAHAAVAVKKKSRQAEKSVQTELAPSLCSNEEEDERVIKGVDLHSARIKQPASASRPEDLRPAVTTIGTDLLRFSSNTSVDVPSLADFSVASNFAAAGVHRGSGEVSADRDREIPAASRSASSPSPTHVDSSSTLNNGKEMQEVTSSLMSTTEDDDYYEEVEEESSSLPTDNTFRMLLDCLVLEEGLPGNAELLERLSRAEGLQNRLDGELANTGRLVDILEIASRLNFAHTDVISGSSNNDEESFREEGMEDSDDQVMLPRPGLDSMNLQYQVLSRLRSEVHAPNKGLSISHRTYVKGATRNTSYYDDLRRSVLEDMKAGSMAHLDLPFTRLCATMQNRSCDKEKSRTGRTSWEEDEILEQRIIGRVSRDAGENPWDFTASGFAHKWEKLSLHSEDDNPGYISRRRRRRSNVSSLAVNGGASVIRPLRGRSLEDGGGSHVVVGQGPDVIKVPLLEDIQEISSQENSEAMTANTRLSRGSRMTRPGQILM